MDGPDAQTSGLAINDGNHHQNSQNIEENVATIYTTDYQGHLNRGLDLDNDVDEGCINTDNNAQEDQNSTAESKIVYKSVIGIRHLFALMAFTALLVSYMNRNNLNIAIVAMVIDDQNSTVMTNDSDVCPLRNYDNSTDGDEPIGEFNWDPALQGTLLGCFFYGYTVSNFLGGVATEYLGGKLVLGASVFSTSVLSLVSPICARTSIGLFIAVRVLSGLAQGPLYPAIFSLMSSWVPLHEKASFSSVIFPGNHMGTVISMALGGVMAGSDFLGGWPSIFYVFGIVGLLWCVAWFLLVENRPEDHRLISSTELKYLQAHISITKTNKSPKIPWLAMLTSPPFLCLLVVAYGDGIGFFTLLTEIPTYLNSIQHFDLASNGLLSALPYLCAIVISPIYGYLMHMLSKKKILSILSIRRLSTAVGLYISGLSLVAMCFVDCDATLAIVFLCIAVGLNGAKYCGALVSEQDIAPNFAGVTKGIVNSMGGITGILAPLITGVITSGNVML